MPIGVSTGPLRVRPIKAVTAVAARSIDGCNRINFSVSRSETTSSGTPCPRSSVANVAQRESTRRRVVRLAPGIGSRAPLLLLERAPLVLLLASNLGQHELQPFAQLRHRGDSTAGRMVR